MQLQYYSTDWTRIGPAISICRLQRQARLGPGLYRPDRASSKPANCLQGPSLYSYNAILVAVFQTKIGPTSEGETILSPATPSMRRPVCVKSVFLFLFSLSFLWIPCIRAGPPLSPSFHPHSWLSDFRSVYGGRCQFIRPRAFRHTMLTR